MFFYFLRRRGRDNIQNMTVLFSGNYVLYSVLNVSNVSLNIILREVYSHSESNNFTSDLENKLKQTYFKTVNSLRTNIHNKDDISHSLKTVQAIHIWIIYFPCPLFFTSHLPCFCCHVVSTLDATQAALQIIWTLCQYIINRTSQQFTVGICRAASSVDIITDYNKLYCILLRAPRRSRPV